MKNEYLKNLNKIEFVITYACTGRCKHCSEGDHAVCGESISPSAARDAVRRIAAEYDIETVMAFGGEPLLYPDAVYAIMAAARDMRVKRRQVITNGYFSKNSEKIREVAKSLAECGVNDLLISVDAFHQETIPLSVVREFIGAAQSRGISMRLQPAWLVSPEDENSYNTRTREILADLADFGVPTSEGNIIFPEGNAKKYLAEYFVDEMPENPYREDPCQIKCVSFEPDGSVFGENFYKTDIMEILEGYSPECL